MSAPKTEWPLWEVFVRSRQGLSHKHVGSLHAADATMAISNARDVYTRRQEGTSIWVVKAEDITASTPSDKDVLFDPANDKVYRHPTFYDLPDEVKNMQWQTSNTNGSFASAMTRWCSRSGSLNGAATAPPWRKTSPFQTLHWTC